jgi:hypothetical protein
VRQHAPVARRLLRPSITASRTSRPSGEDGLGAQQPRTHRHSQQQREPPRWRDLKMQMIEHMDIIDLEPYVRILVAPKEIQRVPKEVATAVVERIAATRVAEFRGCSAKHVSMYMWEVFSLFDKEKVTWEQALPAMRLLVTVTVPITLFKPIDVAQITINLAKFELTDERWFSRLAAGEFMDLDWKGLSGGAKGVEQSIANTIYGLALVSNAGAAAFVTHLVSVAMTKLATFSPQHSSNVLWALAKMQHPLDSPQLLAATGHKDAASLLNAILEDTVLPQLHNFPSQAVTSTMYALALLQMPCDSKVVAALVARSLECVGEHKFVPQDVSIVLWSCVKLNYKVTNSQALRLVEALVQSAAWCNPQNMANTMWALGSGGYPEAALALQQPLHAFLTRHRADFQAQHLSNLVIGLAKLTHHFPELVSTPVVAVKPKLSEFKEQELANLLWSLAVLEPCAHLRLFKEVEPELVSRLPGCDQQALANIAWAYAVVLGDQASRELALGLLRAVCGNERPPATNGYRQLFQLMAVRSSEVQAAVAANEQLSELRVRCATAYAGGQEAYHPTLFADQIAEMEDTLHATCNPQLTASCYGVDLRTNLLTFAGGKQLVFDLVAASRYSSHSSTAQQHHELGYLVIRRRMLAKAGRPDAVMIPAMVWVRCGIG